MAAAVAAIPTVTSVTAATTTTSSATAAGRTIFARTGDIDGQGPTLEFLVVKHFDRLVGVFRAAHLDKREAARFAGEFVQHYVDRGHDAGLGEEILQIVVHRLVGKVAYEETRFIHNQYTLAAQKTEWGVAALAVSLKVARYGG